MANIFVLPHTCAYEVVLWCGKDWTGFILLFCKPKTPLTLAEFFVIALPAGRI